MKNKKKTTKKPFPKIYDMKQIFKWLFSAFTYFITYWVFESNTYITYVSLKVFVYLC